MPAWSQMGSAPGLAYVSPTLAELQQAMFAELPGLFWSAVKVALLYKSNILRCFNPHPCLFGSQSAVGWKKE